MQNTYGLKILRVGQNADLLLQNYLKVGILPYTVLDQLTSKWAETPILKSVRILSDQLPKKVNGELLADTHVPSKAFSDVKMCTSENAHFFSLQYSRPLSLSSHFGTDIITLSETELLSIFFFSGLFI